MGKTAVTEFQVTKMDQLYTLQPLETILYFNYKRSSNLEICWLGEVVAVSVEPIQEEQ